MTMTTLTNGEKSINITLIDEITILDSKQYVLNLPKVICSKLEDADYIQKEINELVNDLARELMKN